MGKEDKLIKDGVRQAAALMEIAARTAPKSRGEDFIEIKTVFGEKLKELSEEMIRFGVEGKKVNFDRDGGNVAVSAALVLIGLNNSTSLGLNCSACGYPDCDAFDKARQVEGDYRGPICAYRIVDLGIAVGSAVKTAQILNVDNRIMYRAGVAARRMGMVDWDYVLGIPLSATGKNIYFDR
ncbi:MAG: DUF2148 domain-containing protein [candidate division Zixibacteria bacterium]